MPARCALEAPSHAARSKHTVHPLRHYVLPVYTRDRGGYDMQSRLSPSRKKWLLISLATLLTLVLGSYTAVYASIHRAVTGTVRSAMAQYPGDRVEALSA